MPLATLIIPEYAHTEKYLFKGVLFFAILISLAGCTKARLLDANFDADPLGKPVASPTPNPPADNFIWTVNNQVTSTVVANPGGGRHVRISPLSGFFPAPNMTRKNALLAISAPLTGGQVRGHADVNISGSAGIVLAVIGIHGSPAKYTNLGGAQVMNLAPGPGFTGSVTSSSIDHIMDPYALNGVFIGNYTGGQTAGIQWSIDPTTHTLNINVFPGGTLQSITYPATNMGVPTTPLSAIGMSVFLVDPAPGASAFVDNFSVEEF